MLLTQTERERKQVAGLLTFFSHQPVTLYRWGTLGLLMTSQIGLGTRTPGLRARELVSNLGSSDPLNHELEL